MPEDHAYLQADAADRLAALTAATDMIAAFGGMPHDRHQEWLDTASHAYHWLRRRDSLRVAAIQLIPGKPYPEGNTVATVLDLSDVQQVTFTLGGTDAKGASVPAPSDTWAWSLADPDATGAVLTVSTDTTSATVAAGGPDSTGTLTLSVTGQSSGLTGAEAILVAASAATAVSLVAGTPSAETPAAPAAPPAS